jgi:Putative lumazine-binding
MQTIDEYDAIAEVVRLYMAGASSGDVAKLRLAFHPDARMFGAAGGKRFDLAMEPFFELSAAHPLDSAGTYRGRLVSVQQFGHAAVAVVAEDGCWGGVSFIDILSLSSIEGIWLIVNKTFAHTGGVMPEG